MCNCPDKDNCVGCVDCPHKVKHTDWSATDRKYRNPWLTDTAIEMGVVLFTMIIGVAPIVLLLLILSLFI